MSERDVNHPIAIASRLLVSSIEAQKEKGGPEYRPWEDDLAPTIERFVFSIIEEVRGPQIPKELLFRVLDSLRLTHIYTLKDSHPEELPDDFKPHKWTNDVEFAEESYALYREVLTAMGADLPVNPCAEIDTDAGIDHATRALNKRGCRCVYPEKCFCPEPA